MYSNREIHFSINMSLLCSVCHICLSFIGIALGLSASVTFYIYGNSTAVFWSFFSAGLALLNLHLHCLKLQGKLEEWHSEYTMSAIKAFSMILFIMISSLLTWFLFRIIYEHLPVFPIKDSLIITSVWTFMTAKWAFMLFLTSKRYENFLREANTPLLASI